MAGRISGIIRRTVLLHLSATAPVLVGCGSGGRVAPPMTDSGTASDAASVDARACNEGVDAGPICTVIACVPPVVNTYQTGCATGSYAIYGTGSQCGPADGGAVPMATCEAVCPPLALQGGNLPLYNCYFSDRNVDCDYGETLCFVTGRRPRGLRPCGPDRAAGRVARYLSRMAHLEAASVSAFTMLARELEAHGAPRRLRDDAVRAAKDEARHARVVGDLAERAGGSVRRLRVRAGRPRSLEAMAIENAVEGCVRETFGAAVAIAQSLTASNPLVRGAMRRIAGDETGHAELSWRVARWLEGRLDRAARDRVARARRRAALSVTKSARATVHPSLVEQLGIPAAPLASAIAEDLARTLWRLT
jgi:hypothetical protein